MAGSVHSGGLQSGGLQSGGPWGQPDLALIMHLPVSGCLGG